MRKSVFFLVVILILAMSACTPAAKPAASVGSLDIISPYIRTGMAEGNTAAFMVIRNNGAEADQLIKAECKGVMMTEIHETKMVDQVMKMSPVDAVEVPAKGEVELKPGGYHVMLMGLMKELKEGEEMPVTLTFAKAGSVELILKARKP